VRVAARAEGCGSIAEGKFRGSVVEALKNTIFIIYIYIYIDRFTYKHDRYSLLLPQTLFQIYPNPQIHHYIPISMHLLKESTGTPIF
jgi:hypothetical protein